MRIALLDPPSFTPPYDHALAAALARRGHDVHLLAAPGLLWPERGENGYRLHEVFTPLSARARVPRRARLVLKGLEYVPSVQRALRRLNDLAPDVVHVQWLGAAPYDVRWLRRLEAERATILTAHDLAPRRRVNARAWGEALGLVDRVIVHSESALERLTALGVAPARLARIPHAVFDPAPDVEPSEPEGHTLLFFGLLRRYKGLDVLIRALPSIVREVPEARLVVAGHPFDPVEPARELAAELGVAERVDWQLRFVPAAELAELLEGAAFAVLPYRDIESSGVLASTLGRGRPAVVSDVGSLGATVREFDAGRVVPREDPQALAAACVELLNDREALSRAATGARAARRALSWESVAAQHEGVYEAVLAERA